MELHHRNVDTETRIAVMADVFEVAYRLDDGPARIDPSFAYAVDQICTELALINNDNDDLCRRARNLARERRYGEARGENSRSLGEFGVELPEVDN